MTDSLTCGLHVGALSTTHFESSAIGEIRFTLLRKYSLIVVDLWVFNLEIENIWILNIVQLHI